MTISYFAEYTITRNIYLMLRNVCCPEMDNMNCRNATDVILQKHGALPHFSLWVCYALNARFHDQWGRICGSITSPPLDFLQERIHERTLSMPRNIYDTKSSHL
jgi:hypothetical protein